MVGGERIEGTRVFCPSGGLDEDEQFKIISFCRENNYIQKIIQIRENEMKNHIAIVCALLVLSVSYYCLAEESQIGGVAEKSVYFAEMDSLMQVKWPDNRTITIVCHGHSVPAGYFETPFVDTFDAYPHLWHRALKEIYPFAVINVIVTGIGGETSESGANRFEQDVLTHHPDIITIDYALNDRGMGLEKARVAWQTMITNAQAQNIKVILLTPTADKGSDMDDAYDPLNQHAEQVRGLAEKYHVGLVDSYAAFKEYVQNGGQLDDLMSQVNHPNRNGHDLVVKALMEWFPE